MKRRVRCLTPLALTLVACGMLVIAACQPPTPLNTDAPTETLTATSAVRPPTAAATTSAAVTATTAVATPSAWADHRPAEPPPGPVTVTLTLDEAEREVLSWFIPINEARIDRSFYVTTEDACVARGAPTEPVSLLDLTLRVDVCAPDPDNLVVNHVRAEAYLIVAASFRGFDIMYPGRTTGRVAGPCDPVSHETRAPFLAWFDATTGRYLGYEPLTGPAGAEALSWYRSVVADEGVGRRGFANARRMPGQGSPIEATATAAAARSTAMERESPATPHPTSSLPAGSDPARALRVGEVPSALADVVSVVPLVPGAWWRYRITAVSNSVHWLQTTYTESIAAGTRLAPDLAAVRSRAETDLAIADPGWISPWGSGGTASVRFLAPDGVLHPLGDIKPHTPIKEWLSLQPDWGAGAPIHSVRLPLRAGEVYNYWWRSDTAVDVSVPAGHFDNCTVTMEMFNAGNTTAHWLCPGVGYVRHEAPGCSSMHSGYRVYELEDYFVPRMTLVP
jgi:hypothetical protein